MSRKDPGLRPSPCCEPRRAARGAAVNAIRVSYRDVISYTDKGTVDPSYPRTGFPPGQVFQLYK